MFPASVVPEIYDEGPPELDAEEPIGELRTRRISLAWVVRDAVDTYLAERWPLLFKKLG